MTHFHSNHAQAPHLVQCVFCYFPNIVQPADTPLCLNCGLDLSRQAGLATTTSKDQSATPTTPVAPPATATTDPTSSDILLPWKEREHQAMSATLTRQQVSPLARWVLELDNGDAYELTSSDIIIGRRPSSDATSAATLTVDDATGTLSKTHARLYWDEATSRWVVMDLYSTNGVAVMAPDGVEHVASPGVPMYVASDLRLGTLRARIVAIR